MRAHRLRITAVVALAALWPASAPADGAPDTVTLHAGLSGAREVPGPGDRDGSGTAVVDIDTTTGQICFRLTVRNIAPASAAHIHRGERDAAGPVVKGLAPPSDGSSSGCVVDQAAAGAVAADPAGHYVNVHNGEFPGGAVRGQLAGRSA